MGFAQEMKDFVSAAEKGWKMMTPTQAEVNAAALRESVAENKRRAALMKAGGKGGGAADTEIGEDETSDFGSDTGTYTPSDKDLDITVRTVFGEAAGESDEGQKAVAAVLKNRANLAGTSLTAEALKPNQFEPWNNPVARRRMTTLKESDPRYQKIKANVLAVIEEGEDPTKGATHFYAPKAQSELGRSTPSWAKGPKKTIGNHVFFKLPYSGRGTHGTDEPEARVLPATAPLPPTGRPAVDIAAAPAVPVVPATTAIPARRVKTTPASAVAVDPAVPTAIDSATGMPIPPDDPRLQTPALDRVHGGRTSALDLYPEEDPYLRSGIYAAKGGLVPGYADGGLVDDDDANDEISPARGQADFNAIRSMGDNPMAYIQYAAGKGLSQIQERFGLTSGAIQQESPRAQDGARALALNVGAPKPEEIKQLEDTADPQGKMTADQRAVHGWGNLIKYYTEQGNPQAVANAGAAMLMHSKRISQQAGALALAAIEQGDLQTASRAITRAYNTFPDGQSIRVNSAGPDGVEYEVVTPKGVNGGKLTPAELKELATGMLNGTQWFQHATQLTQGAKPADLRKQREAKARSEFEESQGDTQSYLKTLSEEDQEKFRRMSSADKNQYLRLHAAEIREAAKQERFNERNTLMAERDEIKAGRMQERDAKKEDMTIFKEALKQKRWDITRDQVMTNFERMAALRERDLSDRNTRHRESLDARQKRYAEIDQRIMERTRGLGEKPEKESARERIERKRLEREETAEERLTSAVEGQTPLEPTGASEGAMQARREQKVAGVVEPIRAGGAFARIPPAERKVDEDDFTEMRKIIDESPAWKAAKGLEEPHKLWASRIAADVHATAGGKLRKEDAVNMVQSAINPRNPEPRVQPDGSVKIVPNLPAVNLTTESMIQLNNLRRAAAGTLRAEEASRFPVEPRARATGPAVPGAVDLERDRAEIAARRAAESRGGSAIDLGRLRDTLMPPIDRAEAVRQAAELQRRDEERRRRQRAIGNIR